MFVCLCLCLCVMYTHTHTHIYIYLQGLAENSIGWIRYSHEIWTNEVYFQHSPPCGPHSSIGIAEL